MWLVRALTLSLVAASTATATEPARIAVVVTSHDRFGDTAEPTGYWLGEVSHFYERVSAAGFAVDFVSPLGGKPPVDVRSLKSEDDVDERFLADTEAIERLEHSLTPEALDPSRYEAIYFAGGHGPIWDLPDNEALQGITRAIFEQGGVVAAVCHGPVALLNVRLSNGHLLVEGKRVTGLANIEERLSGKAKLVPFLLENELKERGGLYHRGMAFRPHIEVSGRLVTGQNPNSTTRLADEVVALLGSLGLRLRGR